MEQKAIDTTPTDNWRYAGQPCLCTLISGNCNNISPMLRARVIVPFNQRNFPADVLASAKLNRNITKSLLKISLTLMQ